MQNKKCKLKIVLILSICMAKILFFPLQQQANAQSEAVLGNVMLTTYMVSQNMFTPHSDNCGDDAWVPLFSGATVGFCIEKNERAAINWIDAVRTCLQAGKRLPEPAEWQLSCYHAGTLGLLNMTNNFEWVSNFSQGYNLVDASSPQSDSPVKIAVTITGNGSCEKSSLGLLATGDETEDVVHYRCVR